MECTGWNVGDALSAGWNVTGFPFSSALFSNSRTSPSLFWTSWPLVLNLAGVATTRRETYASTTLPSSARFSRSSVNSSDGADLKKLASSPKLSSQDFEQCEHRILYP